MGYIYYIYKTTNLTNNKEYIGQRKCTDIQADYTYYGSNQELVKDIKELGRKNFKKEILFTFNSRDDANKKEFELVNFDYLENAFTYNKTRGGRVNDTGALAKNKYRYWKDSVMANRIKEYRKKHALSQKEFCKLCGIGLNLLNNLEYGHIREPKRLIEQGKLERFLAKINPREEILAADITNKGE